MAFVAVLVSICSLDTFHKNNKDRFRNNLAKVLNPLRVKTLWSTIVLIAVTVAVYKFHL